MDRLIAICIATYRRPEMLAVLLDSLDRMIVPDGYRTHVRIVDNDHNRSAEPVAQVWRRHRRSTIRYEVEPRNSISLARNRAVDMGPADLVMFIDDDEIADPRCLLELAAALDRTGADASFGFVGGLLPPGAPRWMVRGGFFDHPAGGPDERLSWRATRAGCTMVRGRWFYEERVRFDPAFGRSGGEDVDLFARLAAGGAQLVGAPLAVAWEHVPRDRSSLRSLLRRQYRNGINFERLCRRHQVRRHPAVRLGGRLARCAFEGVAGLPALLLGRPERAVRAALGAALAAGGAAAWWNPCAAGRLIAYGHGPGEERSSSAEPVPTSRAA
ncbi:MAG: glycosyltransferase family 2 protein [Planctomycetota bacterium]|jgi:glycosyltransferase involved in cell wall biosynthesis